MRIVPNGLTEVSGDLAKGPNSTNLDKQVAVCCYSYAKASRIMEQNSVLLTDR